MQDQLSLSIDSLSLNLIFVVEVLVILTNKVVNYTSHPLTKLFSSSLELSGYVNCIYSLVRRAYMLRA